VPNTIDYVRQVIADEAFRHADVQTGFLLEHGDRILAAVATAGAGRQGEREPRQDDR
jgi:hypothetical protein